AGQRVRARGAVAGGVVPGRGAATGTQQHQPADPEGGPPRQRMARGAHDVAVQRIELRLALDRRQDVQVVALVSPCYLCPPPATGPAPVARPAAPERTGPTGS